MNHPHIEFFDRLAKREDRKDPRLSRLLCGVRDQILAAAAKGAASPMAVQSVKRTLNYILANYKNKQGLQTMLTKFLNKVTTKKSII